jgi:hypothetical protein
MPNLTIPSGFLKAEDLASLMTARWCIFARNGRGKTWFLRSIPPNLRFLYVTVGHERGIRAVAHMLRTQANQKGNLIPYVINRFNDLQKLLETVDQMIEKGWIDGMAWDTLSRVQDLAIGKIMSYEPTQPGSEKDYVDRIPKTPKGYDSWDQVGALTIEWVRYFNRRPIHQIYLLQEQDREVKYDENVQTITRLTPGAYRGLYDDMELVGRLYVEVGGQEFEGQMDESGIAVPKPVTAEALISEGKEDKFKRDIDPNAREVRKLFIGAHDRYWTKGNTAVLGRVISDPTWDKLAVSLSPTPESNGKK